MAYVIVGFMVPLMLLFTLIKTDGDDHTATANSRVQTSVINKAESVPEPSETAAALMATALLLWRLKR